MRILIVSNLYPPGDIGGYELACSQAAQFLSRMCHDVLVLTSQPGITPPVPPDARPAIERSLAITPVFDATRLEHHTLGVLQRLEAQSQWFDGHNAGALIEAVERFRPDVAYLWNMVGIGGVGLVSTLRMLDIPWVWHLCDRVPFQLCSERGQLLPPMADAFGHLVEGRWIVLSDQLRAEIGAAGVPLRGRVTKLPLWVDTEGVDVHLPEPAGDRPLRLAFAGQVATHKGADLVVEAAAELHRRGLGVSLDLWGEVIDTELPGRAAAAGIGDGVVFHGARPHAEVVAGIAACDLLLFPTWPREPFGIVPAEAAAVGTPPILSPSGVAEWLDDGMHALHVTRDVDSVVEAVLRVDRGEVDLVELARRGASRVRSDMDIGSIMPSVESELRDVARPYPGSPRRARRAYSLSLVAGRLLDDVVGRRWHGR